MFGILKWSAVALFLLIAVLLLPVAYVEMFCTDEHDRGEETRMPTVAPQWRRAEANSFLTYPEWHIVYAYEGLANRLVDGDAHAFDYAASIAGFWRSACALSREASRVGEPDFATRSTMHTIGVSFTFEMAVKALYEETLGRVFAALRSGESTPQDEFEAREAETYARFLQQVPWYRYDFERAVSDLWSLPVTGFRSWERRLALAGEWNAKAAYARLIAKAAEGAGPAALTIRSVVSGLEPAVLGALDEVRVIKVLPDGSSIIETPRYRQFTRILRSVAAAGGRVEEIAGNDDILVTMIDPPTDPPGRIIARVPRDGFEQARVLVAMKVPELTSLLAGENRQAVEHVYDY